MIIVIFGNHLILNSIVVYKLIIKENSNKIIIKLFKDHNVIMLKR